MSLADVTKKIKDKLAPSKVITIDGVSFVIRVASYEHQTILDTLTEELKDGDTATAEEITRKSIAYSLESVDGEDVTTDRAALMEEIRKWPSFLVNTLGATIMNFRYESSLMTAEKTKYEWFNIEDFVLNKSADKVKSDLAAEEAAAASAEGADPSALKVHVEKE